MSREVHVYTQNSCGACPTVLTFLKNHGVPIKERNLDDEEYGEQYQQEYNKLGVMGVPTVAYKDKVVAVGFDLEPLSRLAGKVGNVE